jgi:PAT family beta-lactamase induction signal transducer AmpG
MKESLREAYFNQRMLALILLGFSSGLPAALSTTALQTWYTVAGLSYATIGMLSLLGQPYVYKFIWAPIVDLYVFPFLGRRRGWIIVMQLSLIATILAMSIQQPQLHPWMLAMTGMLLALFSATQDITIDAYSTDILPEAERGLGAAFKVGGYRVAMIVSGAASFVIADHFGWQFTYQCMAGIMLIGVLGTLIAPEPIAMPRPTNLLQAIKEPLYDFFTRDAALAILLFIVLYKLGDAFAVTLSSSFFIRGVGFSQTEVGLMSKGVGLTASIIGVFIGGSLMVRMGQYAALLWFGVLQAFSNLLFMLLAIVGKSLALLGTVIAVDYACNGMGTAALVAFIMSLCNKRFTATQYALLTAVSAIGRVFVGPAAGVLVEHVGWAVFFFWSFILALPGLAILLLLRNQVKQATLVQHSEI